MMEERDILNEINARLQRLEEIKKTERIVKTVSAVILAVAVVLLGIMVKNVTGVCTQLEQIMPVVNDVAEKAAQIDTERISSFIDGLETMDTEALNDIMQKIREIDVESLNNMITSLNSVADTLSGFFH